MSAYMKTLVASFIAVLYAGLVAWQANTGDGFQAVDLLPLIAAVGAAFLTYLVPNVPALPWAKTAVNLVLNIVAALSVLFADGTTGINITAILVTVIGAIAVYQVPNKGYRHNGAPVAVGYPGA